MTEPAIAIVPARHDQLAEVQRVAGIIWRAHYPTIISPVQIEYMLARGYALDALASFLAAADRGLELATVDRQIAGLAAWYMTTEPATAKLDKLYVLPSLQRHGLGRRLVRHVEAMALVAGAETLILNVNKRNAQAIRAYERYGFAIREAVVVDIGEGHVMDDYIMARSLTG